ncbi:MAG: sulfite exporter TauE/SafE family protein [Acidimicrobiia bacterium]|nr:sulfite exporter TauE/SafE family protein [Acidimicrobiia bacterium]
MDASELLVALAAVVVGFGAGVLSGMLGIGGAVISTPAVRLLGASPLAAVGSTVPAILPGALSGAWRYHREGLVDYRVGLTCGGAGTVFAVLGALVATATPEPGWLMVATAALMLWSGWSVARSGRHASGPRHPGTVPPTRPAVPTLVLLGAGAGFVAGLLGVGGGIVLLPIFTSILHLPVKRAIGSSLVAVAVFSVPALVTHALAGNIDWLLAIPLVLGVVPGARVGARLTVGAPDQRVRLVFGVAVAILAVVYGGAEIVGLTR